MIKPNRIVITWSPPLDPKIYGYGPRIDHGGYVYQMYRDGRKVMSGSSHADLDRTIERLRGYAAEKGLTDPQLIVNDPR